MPSTSCMTRVIKSNRRRSITDSVRIWSHAVSLWPRPYGRVRAGTRTFLSCFAQADVRRQHPKRCHQYPLRLLLSRRSPIPALAQRTFAHAALQADHVPHAGPAQLEILTGTMSGSRPHCGRSLVHFNRQLIATSRLTSFGPIG
jgi:hypothetical protein